MILIIESKECHHIEELLTQMFTSLNSQNLHPYIRYSSIPHVQEIIMTLQRLIEKIHIKVFHIMPDIL